MEQGLGHFIITSSSSHLLIKLQLLKAQFDFLQLKCPEVPVLYKQLQNLFFLSFSFCNLEIGNVLLLRVRTKLSKVPLGASNGVGRIFKMGKASFKTSTQSPEARFLRFL